MDPSLVKIRELRVRAVKVPNGSTSSVSQRGYHRISSCANRRSGGRFETYRRIDQEPRITDCGLASSTCRDRAKACAKVSAARTSGSGRNGAGRH